MANYPVEETLLREPNLWVPRKKPVGRVKIDWTHPLTRGLAFYMLHSKVNGRYRDLTGRIPVPFTPFDSTEPPLVIGKYGEALDCSSGHLVSDGWFGLTEQTFAMAVQGIHYDSTPGSEMVFSARESGLSNSRLYTFPVGTDIRHYVGNDYDTGLPITVGEYTTLAPGRGSLTSGNHRIGYTNGVGGVVGTFSSSSGVDDFLAIGATAGATGGNNCTGKIYWTGLWLSRYLTPVEHMQLHLDPYQFLIPA